MFLVGINTKSPAPSLIVKPKSTFNFGSGFGQTAVSTGNSDANGYGNFEYAVPSGFYSWNSKNLAEFG